MLCEEAAKDLILNSGITDSAAFVGWPSRQGRPSALP
jgi:hypothetical protein